MMNEQVSLPEAEARLGALVRQAAHARGRITITDHGEPAAVLISPQELADLEEAVALAEFRVQQAVGVARTVPHEEVGNRLGLSPA